MIPGNNDRRDGILFSLPFMVVYIAFMVYPLLSGLYVSFFKWDILSTPSFLGLANYRTLFSDEKFYTSLWHTFKFVLMTTPTLLVVGFVMALAITGTSPLKSLMENIFFFPYIFSMTVVATLWAWILQKDWGIINQLLMMANLKPISWLTNERWAMWSVALTTLWWTAGFNMVLFGAAIKQIPKEIYESAAMDGASYLTRDRKSTRLNSSH